MAQVVTQLIVDASGAKTGVAEFEAAMQKAKRAAVDAGETTASSFERAQSRWTQSLAKTDPVIKAQIAMEKDLARQREINANAVKLGIATQDAANTQLEKVRAQHQAYIATLGNVAGATQKFSAQTGLARHELINLSRQAQDVVVSLQGGQGFGTVMLQQGSQILDVLGTSQGGIRGSLASLGTSLRGLVTVGRVAFGGIAAAAAGAALATSSYLSQQKEVERSLIGAGRRSASTGDINRIANNNSSLTGLSISETREAAVEFAKTGQIHSRVIGEMIETTKNFALVTGQSSKEAAASLAGAFTNMQGIDQLNKQFNFLDANTRRYIENLLLAGRTTDAAQLANAALVVRLKDVEETQGALEKGWTAIGNAISNATSKVGEYIAKSAGLQGGGLSGQADNLREQIKTLEARNASAGSDVGGWSGPAGLAARGRVSETTREIAQLKAELAPIEAVLSLIEQHAAFKKLSVDAAQAVASMDPLRGALDSVVGKLTLLRDAQAQGIDLPGLQMAVNYYEQIAQHLQNQMQAQDALATKYPGMTAEFAKQVESLEQQNRLLKARENGTEASVSAAIAYENAIAAGANETEAAAIKALTLKNNLLQSASAANDLHDQLGAVVLDFSEMDAYERNGGHRPGTVIGFENRYDFKTDGKQYESEIDNFPFLRQQLAQLNGEDPLAFSGGFGQDPREAPIPFGLYAQIREKLNQQRIAGLNAQAQYLGGSNLNSEKIAGMQMQIDMLYEGISKNPENIWQIRSLERSIEELKNAVDENTAALDKVTLNPLYTQGRSALKLGYMGAAKGMDFTVQGGIPGIDSVPIHIMAQQGERVQVTPAGTTANDNSRTNTVYVTNNFGGSPSSKRRSATQLAQRYGQIMAALS